jgi:hypothetical protein
MSAMSFKGATRLIRLRVTATVYSYMLEIQAVERSATTAAVDATLTQAPRVL